MSMKYKRIIALFRARNIEFIRDKGDVVWNLLVPFLIILGFSLMSSEEESVVYKLAFNESYLSTLEESPIYKLKYVKFMDVKNYQEVEKSIKNHQVDMYIDFEKKEYVINSDSNKGYFLEKIISSKDETLKKKVLFGEETRYVDWLVPGLLAMNVMFAAFWGIGFAIVRYRKCGILKRFRVTPLSSLDFLLAQLFSRLWIIIISNGIVFLGSSYFFGIKVEGSYLLIFLIFLLGSICLISLSLVVASRMESEEFASGILNVMALPMMFLSGVWFSLDGESSVMTLISDFLPLTHFVSAAREVMIEGASIFDIVDHLTYLLLMTVSFLFIGAFLFKWK